MSVLIRQMGAYQMAQMDWEKARRVESVRRAPTPAPKPRRLTRGSFGSDMTPTQRARFYARGAEIVVRKVEVPPGT